MNVKKMFASLAGVLMLASTVSPLITGAASYSEELEGAYNYAKSRGITTMATIDDANMYGDLTRGQLSKMISQWAEEEMGVEADETAACSFTDTNTAEGDLATYVVKSCQMGLMGQGIEAFRPNDKVTRGEFGTVLSRAIWGEKYNTDETPFYAKHLQALKDAGIMTKIEEPNSIEMRGWVMLMLQRAAETVNPSECNDPAVLLACALDAEGCPAACKDGGKEDGNTVVKSGDLSITATAAEGKKVVLNGGTSDLDTITLKASETITLNSITLERYGFSSYKDVANIWLENANGVKIANEKTISSSKDSVTLNIKKEYRTIEKDDTITVVVETNPFYVAAHCSDGSNKTESDCTTAGESWIKAVGDEGYDSKNAGTNIGFKVTAVESSAKNLDISNYSPYLYDMVTYDSSKVTINAKGKDTTYHYVVDNSYEVARFQVKAGNAAVVVNGFTLTNNATLEKFTGKERVDLDKYVDSVRVTLGDGTELKNVRFDANKDDELKVSFDDVEVAINKNVIFVVEVVFKDFDDYNRVIAMQIENSSDLNVQEKKTGARATVVSTPVKMHEYLFQGGKIEVENTKLASTIDAAAGSTNITIGKGKITLAGESIELNKFTIRTDESAAIESMKMSVGNDEYEAKKVSGGFQFDKITIDESSDIEFTIDIVDETDVAKIVFLNSFDKTTLLNDGKLGRYEEARSDITSSDWAGSISLSNVRIQEAQGSLSANSTKDVEVLVKQTSRKTIFEGEYTASKQDVYLNGFAVMADKALESSNSEITYYLSINGKEVGSFDYTYDSTKTTEQAFIDEYEQGFSDILIKDGEKASVKLEANVYGNAKATYAPTLIIRGSDKDGNPAGFASEPTAKIKVVDAGSVTVSDSAVVAREGVALNDTNITLARFVVQSSKNSEGMTLTNFTLDPTTADDGRTSELAKANLRVRVAGKEVTNFTVTAGKIVVSELSEDIPSAGVDVEVIIKKLPTDEGNPILGKYAVTLTDVNTSKPGIKFSKLIVKSLASIKAQENIGDSTTKFTFAVDKDDSELSVRNLVLFTDTDDAIEAPLATVEDNTTLEVSNGDSVKFITAIAYTTDAEATAVTSLAAAKANAKYTVIEKSEYRDFFKVGSQEAQVFRTK